MQSSRFSSKPAVRHRVLTMVPWSFFEDGGLIWVDLGPERSGFAEALNDGVSTLAPRGRPSALSIYWIDHALKGEHLSAGEVITGGNMSTLVRTEQGVRAEADYETFEPQEMSIKEFVDGLKTWRKQVIDRSAGGEVSLPEQAPYQRNPFDSVPTTNPE